MEKLYTINDLVMMTDLSDRTLRNYIKMGFLDGKKTDGVWRFTNEDVERFFSNETVKFSLKTKRNAIVYDFLADRHKKSAEVCVILDDCADDVRAEEISRFFCDEINQDDAAGKIKFSFERAGQNVRIILRGDAERVYELVKKAKITS